MKIRGRKRRPSEDSLPSSCHESTLCEPTSNHLHLQYNSHSKNNKVTGNSLIARPILHHSSIQLKQQQQQQQMQQQLNSSFTGAGLMARSALDNSVGAASVGGGGGGGGGSDSDQELDKMDDCAAAMVLMSLSCSPKSPIFPNFTSPYGSSSFHYFNATSATFNNGTVSGGTGNACTSAGAAACSTQKCSSGDHLNVAHHHQAFTSSSSPSASSPTSSSFSSSSIPVSVNDVKYSASWKSGISTCSTDSGVTIGSFGVMSNSSGNTLSSSVCNGNTSCSSNGFNDIDEDSRSVVSPSPPNITSPHTQLMMITANGEVSQPASILSTSSPSTSPSPCSPLQVASAAPSIATCSFIPSSSSSPPLSSSSSSTSSSTSPHKPVITAGSQNVFASHNKLAAAAAAAASAAAAATAGNNNYSNSEITNNSNSNSGSCISDTGDNNNSVSHMDEGVELDSVCESVFSPLATTPHESSSSSSSTSAHLVHHNHFYQQHQQQQQHQSQQSQSQSHRTHHQNSHSGKKRIIYECTFPGCNTRYRQNSAIERHVRSLHLGPNPGVNEEEFYYTEVEEDYDDISSSSFVFNGGNTASSIMQQQQQHQHQQQHQQQQLRHHHQQQFVHSSHHHHQQQQNQIQSPRRLADSPSIASSDGSSNSSHSPIPSPGPYTLGLPTLTTAPPTWSHMDMVRPPHEDPEYQKQQQAQYNKQSSVSSAFSSSAHLTTSPINIPGVNFTRRNSSSGLRTGLSTSSSSTPRLISHNKNKLMRVEGKPISLLASPPSLPTNSSLSLHALSSSSSVTSSASSSSSSAASTSSSSASFFASAGASKVSTNCGGTSNRGRGRGETRKCRKVYGMESRDAWCTQCKWKKACTRFTD